MSMDMIDGIAVTYGPGLVGSLLVGIEAAKTLAYIFDKPLIPVHHIRSHIYANNLEKELKFPLICLVISGGHTELLLIKDHFNITKIGSTLDDAVGECYDKVARVIGISYPGGPVIDKMAHDGKPIYDLPIPLNDDSYNFSFSGLKSAVINLYHNYEQAGKTIDKNCLASSFQDVVISSLTTKTMRALKEYNVKATFFVLGNRVEQNPDLVKRAYNEGHYIANHGYSHNNKKLYASSYNFLNEIKSTDLEISKALGIENYTSHLYP